MGTTSEQVDAERRRARSTIRWTVLVGDLAAAAVFVAFEGEIGVMAYYVAVVLVIAGVFAFFYMPWIMARSRKGKG